MGSSSEGAKLTAGRALLVGDAAHLVDPLFGEGIYYAVLSGQLAAESIKDHLRGQTDLSSFADRVARQIYPEFRVAGRIAWVLYTFPRVFHRIVRRRPDIIQLFYDVLKGVETYQSFYVKAKGQAADSLVTVLKSW
jgi:flavin-dependent dehydrogenase